MARSKSPLQIRLEYYPLKGFWSLLRVLPLSLSDRLCRWLIHALLRGMPKRRHILEANLAICFPELSQDQRDMIAQQSLKNLARGIALYPRIPSLCLEGLENFVQIEGFQHLTKALQSGNGAITFTAHYGFWEMMAIYVTRLHLDVSMIVRPLDNPLLDTWVTSVRSSGGGHVIPHRRALREGLTALRQNRILGILIDQNFYKGGIFVDFFGKPAATTTVVSLLARRTGCAVLPIHNTWENGHIRIICEAPMRLSQNPDPEQAIAEDTQTMTKKVEEWIRRDPAQWLWLHNRWKRRPEPGEFVYSPGVATARAVQTKI